MQVGNRSMAIARCAFPQDALVRPAITSWNNVYWESTLGSTFYIYKYVQQADRGAAKIFIFLA